MNAAKAVTTKLAGLFASMFVVALMLFVQSPALADDPLDVTVEGGEADHFPLTFDVVWQDGTTQTIDVADNGTTTYDDGDDHGNLEYASVYGTTVPIGEEVQIAHPWAQWWCIYVYITRYNGRWYIRIVIRWCWW
jgi:hypothetical protein